MKSRIAIPAKVKDAVLREFNHRCALCGADRPQVHHIDEDPANNASDNLLPLCPNCHLTDQHNPTRRIDSDRLKLFRRFKDPVILSPQAEPLHRRLRFLSAVEVSEEGTTELEEQTKELVGFVRALEKGAFYGEQLSELLSPPGRFYVTRLGGGPDPEFERTWRAYNRQYREKLVSAHGRTLELTVELLRYQPWSPPRA